MEIASQDKVRRLMYSFAFRRELSMLHVKAQNGEGFVGLTGAGLRAQGCSNPVSHEVYCQQWDIMTGGWYRVETT